jgi:hypothetical protein
MEVRVYFRRVRSEMFETRWSRRAGRPSKADLRALAELVEAERPALLDEWEAKVIVKDPGAQR